MHEILRNNVEQIAEWMTKNSHEKIKVLEFSHSYKIGRGVVCGKKGAIEEFTKSRIVLKKDPSHKLGFIIISAFPVKEDI